MEIFNFILIAYTVIGAVIFQWIDESIANEPWHEAIFFTFSTVTTIGYGRVVPKSTPSKIFCIFYIFFGVPLAFFVLSNLGVKLGSFFWRIRAGKSLEKSENVKERRLPLMVVTVLLILHLLLGGFIFCVWIDHLSFVDGLYFSFISISTIGFGDIVPKPDSALTTSVSIMYTTTGFVIMTIIIADLLDKLDLWKTALKQYSLRKFFYPFIKNLNKSLNPRLLSDTSDDSKSLLEDNVKFTANKKYPGRKPSLPDYYRVMQSTTMVKNRSFSMSQVQ